VGAGARRGRAPAGVRLEEGAMDPDLVFTVVFGGLVVLAAVAALLLLAWSRRGD